MLEKSPKPSIEIVLAYANPIVRKFISKHAADLPEEQKEEIRQVAALRVYEAYKGLDPDAGWKSFVYNHCRGAVLDYLKAGDGFEEDNWGIQREEENEAVHVGKIRTRMQLVNTDDEDLDVGSVLGVYGKFTEVDLDHPKIKWDVLAKLASQDKPLHAFLKVLRGQSLDEIGQVLGESRPNVGQLVEQFTARFDDPAWAAEFAKRAWLDQIIWAFGLARHFNLRDCDQSQVHGIPLGQGLVPVDLDSTEVNRPAKDSQMGLFSNPSIN